MDQVDLVMAEMLKDAKTASATHNIVGYRVQNPDTGKIEQVSCAALIACRSLWIARMNRDVLHKFLILSVLHH